MTTDYLIIGQGICGTMLSYYLKQAGKKVLVIDDAKPYTASKVASGVINPVTGRRIVRTWMIEELMPFAVNAYKKIEEELHTPLIKQCNILDLHPTAQMHLAFEERRLQEPEYLHKTLNEEQWKQYFNYPFGIGEISPSWLIDINILLNKWRKHLQKENALLEEKFDYNSFKTQRSDSQINYRDIQASTIIFCDGVAGTNNPFFHLLPYAKNKGEALIVEIKDLPRTNMYKQGINIVPWKDNLFWVGSSYEWDYTDEGPTEQFRKRMEMQLNAWLKQPYTIVNHLASARPANIERRPFVGIHPLYETVGILNGMGTKGCSLSPYFAHQLTEHLLHGTALNPLADVQRFSRILSR
jgi:glycine/D-amino acid oxidase-like deaminating enzyme